MSGPGLRFSLSRQLALWVSLYLVLAIAIPAWLVQQKLGFGWRALVDGEVGDPLFDYLASFEPDFQVVANRAELAPILAKIAAHTRMDVQMIAGRDGEHVAGSAFPLTTEVIRLHSPPGAGGPGGPGGPGGRGGPPGGRAPPDGGPGRRPGGGPPVQPVALDRGERPPGRVGNKVQGYVSRDPQYYWIIFRIPLRPDSPLPRQPALILRTASPWVALGNLNLAPIGWPLALLAAASLVFWAVPLWWLTRRLQLATAATERIAAGNFDVRLAPGPADEIGRLALSINELSRRLAEHVGGQRRFIGDVAHEITAPLARLQFAVGILAENAEPDPALRPAAEQVHRELANTLALVDELLGYARTGAAGTPIAPATLELQPLVERIVAAEGVAARATLNLPADLTVRVDPKLLERALANLARNFLRHTPPAARLTVTARRSGDRVVLTLADDGPGVPPEILARLGEPFFRAQPMAPDQPGHGLGLAIVRTCVTACGGEVVFRAVEPHGFAAEVTLPAA